MIVPIEMDSPMHGQGALVARAREGEQGARDELARRTGRAAYVFALQLTADPDGARDIAQDCVMRFFRSLDRFDPGQPVEPWLFAIVRNRVRDLARRERLRRHESLERWLEDGGHEPRDPSPGPAAHAEDRELRRQIWRAISGLSATHREIVVLRDYHELSYREIAEVLSIPVGTVMSRLHTARLRLREALDDPPRSER